MRLVAELLRLSATDLANHLGCAHLSQLDLAVAEGRARRPHRKDPIVELLTERGREHEAAYLKHLRAQKLIVAEITQPTTSRRLSPPCATARTSSTKRRSPTSAGMAAPTFLRKVAAPSALGDVVVRGHGREARDGDARRHDLAALRVFDAARAAARSRAAGSARRSAAPSLRPRKLSARRLRRLLPAREEAARNRARGARRHHVPRAGPALRRLQLVEPVQCAPPRRRSSDLRRRHQPATDQGAAHAPERRHARAARRSKGYREAEARVARGARAHARPSLDPTESTPLARATARGLAARARARLLAPARTGARRFVPRSRRRSARARRRPRVSLRRHATRATATRRSGRRTRPRRNAPSRTWSIASSRHSMRIARCTSITSAPTSRPRSSACRAVTRPARPSSTRSCAPSCSSICTRSCGTRCARASRRIR